MKKFLGILAAIAVGFFAFGIVTMITEANEPIFGKNQADDQERAKQISLEILRGESLRRQIGNVDDFTVKRVEIDDLKMAHTHVQQTINGIPVWESEAIVHLKPDGELLNITDQLKETVTVNTEPNFKRSEALNLAKQTGRGGTRKLTDEPKIDLWIYRGDDRDHLAYRVEMPRIDGTAKTSVPVVFIDAQTGEKVFEYDNLQTGTGSSLYSGTVTISTSTSAGTFYMEEPTGRRQGTFNMNNTGNTSTGTGGTQSRYTGTDDVWSATNERAGVDAHYGAAKTFDYYQTVHGRNGIDGNFGPGTTTSAVGAVPLVVSRVHFGPSYNNAFWFNNQMTYGDGDGSTFTPLTTIDICGHEMTHGVTERTANLTYARESGALNESMSDIFGAMVEAFADGAVSSNTWLIGEDAYTPGTSGDALRRMDNPNAVGDPDHYSVRLYPGTCTPSNANDQCGVHTNSSIQNHAYYLMAAGGTNRVSGVTVTGMGTNDAARVFYRALTVYMTASTNFAGARTATLNAATDLFGSGSTQYNTVATGWCAVGVGSCPGGPTPTPTPTATPTPGGGGELLVNGAFESSVSPWVSSGTGAFYTNAGSYPHGGTGYIYFGVNNSVTGQSYQTVSIPATAAGTLTFWLNVTSSETTTTVQYDKLFVEVRNTAGTLLATPATYSNLNKGTAGVYSQKSLNLSAYKGQTVRVQFRTTMDSSITTTFRVDDASLR
ncbi:MAG: M4 family metallopeptidase [Acidobacteria bacterium]|nr:M4 family metallopeptidase [Acidobacteriota bacterium]